MKFFCFGWGYSSTYLGEILGSEGWDLHGTVRQADKVRTLELQNVNAFIYGSQQAEILQEIKTADAILCSVPPVAGEDIVLKDFGAALLDFEGWLGYLSTSGVYGDRNGAWVDESSLLEPTSARSVARVTAESSWLELGSHIFRIAGIYGKGRNALESVKKGTARRVFKKDHVFSRIHVEDIAAIVRASIERPNPRSIYNLCDDEAAPPQDVVAYACELLSCPLPPLLPIEDSDLSPMALSFYNDSKRVSNKKIKEELQICLQYPNYRVGLQSLLHKE